MNADHGLSVRLIGVAPSDQPVDVLIAPVLACRFFREGGFHLLAGKVRFVESGVGLSQAPQPLRFAQIRVASGVFDRLF